MRARMSVISCPALSHTQPMTSTTGVVIRHEAGWSTKKWQRSVSTGERVREIARFRRVKQKFPGPAAPGAGGSFNRDLADIGPIPSPAALRARQDADDEFALQVVERH